MMYNYGSLNLEKIEILNDTKIKIRCISDRTGNYLVTVLFIDVCNFLYCSAQDDIEEDEPIFIIDFIIQKLNEEEKENFSNNFLFQPTPNGLIPNFKIELHSGEVEIVIFCKEIKVLEKTKEFNITFDGLAKDINLLF